MNNKIIIYFLLVMSCCSTINKAFTQCAGPIASFPYKEGFESSSGNWIVGGNNPDWAWGTPAKSVINTAGSGTKCWVIGGLTGNAYNGAELSWLQSPCFDFSAIQHPYVSFKVFWEMERRYDGANFQYSTDNGNNWQNVGSSSDQANCLNTNWFNSTSINYLAGLANVPEGWSGNIQSTSGSCQGGGGSGGWVLAQHTMPYLAGQPAIMFRFTFGAGTQCNNFNGFAIDDINFSEAPANQASFTYSCSDNRTINFASSSPLCPTTYSWSFDDDASGAANESAESEPTHVFSAAGNYTVTLTVTGPDNASSTTTQNITVLDVAATITTPIRCFGDNNGAITSSVTGNLTAADIRWNTSPVQTTPSINNLTPGVYTVTASVAGSCPVSATVELIQPTEIQNTVVIVNPGCTATAGSINISTTGGSSGYTYTWLPAVSSTAGATNLSPGAYKITVTDTRQCSTLVNVNIVNVVPPAISFTNVENVTCQNFSDGSVTAQISPADPGATYTWNTSPVQQTATANNLVAGNYTVTVNDNNGCTATGNTIITEPITLTAQVNVTADSCAASKGKIVLQPAGGTAPYSYTWTPALTTTESLINIPAGDYFVTVTDDHNCAFVTSTTVKNIGQPARPSLGRDTTICEKKSIDLAPGNFAQYVWQDNSSLPFFKATQDGTYSVKVTNNEGCVGTDNIVIKFVDDCGDVYFPNAFIASNSAITQTFGPVGNLSAISNYKFMIFNRYGQTVFVSQNPADKWDGLYKGCKAEPGTFVWQAAYTFKNISVRQVHGTVILIR